MVKNGGRRPGSGRKPGKLSEETLIRTRAERAYKLRVARLTDKLLNSQLALAEGEMNLYVKTKRGNKTITTMIDDPQVVIDYLDGNLTDSDNEYYYLATKSPDGKALDSLLDRTYGKAKQSMDITTDDEPINTLPVSPEILANFKEFMLESTKSKKSKDQRDTA